MKRMHNLTCTGFKQSLGFIIIGGRQTFMALYRNMQCDITLTQLRPQTGDMPLKGQWSSWMNGSGVPNLQRNFSFSDPNCSPPTSISDCRVVLVQCKREINYLKANISQILYIASLPTEGGIHQGCCTVLPIIFIHLTEGVYPWFQRQSY